MQLEKAFGSQPDLNVVRRRALTGCARDRAIDLADLISFHKAFGQFVILIPTPGARAVSAGVQNQDSAVRLYV